MVLINEWAYFQPAGDSGMSKRNGGNFVIGCGSNGGRAASDSSNFQRPIMSCLNEEKDQQHQHQLQQRQHPNYNVNQMMHVQNQQHQVNMLLH